MSLLMNILWLVLGGVVTAVEYIVASVGMMVTIIGIPFGIQCFKFASMNFTPFGKNVRMQFEEHPIMNVIWLILFGWEMALGYLASGVLCCITIVGIPFGLQSFKLLKLAIFPFGADIVAKN